MARSWGVWVLLGLLAVLAVALAASHRGVVSLDAAGPGTAAACTPTWHATVPLEFHEHDATVPVGLDGHATQFAFDTGTSDTYVTHEAQQKFALRPAAHASWSVTAVAEQKTVDTFLDVASLRFAGLEFGPRAMPLTDLGYAATSPARAVEMGLMGVDLLKGLEVDIDIPEKRITLYRFDAACRDVTPLWAGAYATIPITPLRSGTPTIPLQLNGTSVRAIFDTGAARTTLDYDEDDEDAYASLGEAAEGDPNWLRSMAIGGHSLAPVAIAIGDKPLGHPNQTRLGIDVIGRHRFWLSLGSMRLFMAAPG